MVEHPEKYPWSSYGHNAQGELKQLIRPYTLYELLGANAESRQRAYRVLFRYQGDPGLVDQIRTAANGGFGLGSECFQQEIVVMVGLRTWRGHP